MDIRELYLDNMPVIEVKGVKNLDVGKTFDCGQCFRFDPVENSRHESEYAGVAFGRHVSFASEGSDLYIYNSDVSDFEGIWRRYLCLDMDYDAVNADILKSSGGGIMEAAMEYGRGIRILRQEPYEAVISFIVSQNNNIPRIKKIIEAMSAACGEELTIRGDVDRHSSGSSSMRAFPTHAALIELGEQGLFELKTGFRARYIYDAVKRLSEGALILDELENAQTTEACLAGLCQVKGIGLKVASCAALFGMARYDAFPIDVWMKRVAEKYFPDVKDFSGAMFGKYAGIAQQYLFYYERYNQSKSVNGV